MKVFLVGSPRGHDNFSNFYTKIYEEVKKNGYTHTNTEFINTNSDEFYKQMKESEEHRSSFYKNMLKGIQNADICIFETSTHSSGTGFLLDKSLELNKPTIVLYYKGNNTYLFQGIDDEKLIIKEYDEKSLKKVLLEALEMARERRDKRFNFFISPKLLDYLEKASNTEGITKSKFIRNLIVNKIRSQTKQEDLE